MNELISAGRDGFYAAAAGSAFQRFISRSPVVPLRIDMAGAATIAADCAGIFAARPENRLPPRTPRGC